MVTTSLKLPEDLKERAASAARSRGLSMHAFMLEAVRQATTAAEKRAAFIADAKSASDAMHRSGEGYAAEHVHEYIRAKARGETPDRPKPVSWRD